MKIYKTDKHVVSIKPGKQQIRIHIPISTYEYLKSKTTGKQGLGTVISNLVEAYQDRYRLERKVDALTGDVKKALQRRDEDTVSV